MKKLPQFPYGAVYFRKSNPPREDWERDYKVAAEDGINMFRHWFLWSAIEIAPGIYDWEDYDRQLDLAAQNGITTMIAEFMTAAPEWAIRQYDHARYEDRHGRRAFSSYSGSCVTGGFHTLCLDNDDVREIAGRWLAELVSRYQDHPGLGGYDIWNECNYPAQYCYCAATQAKFREWLQKKYGDIRALAQAWQRHSLASWEDVQAPRHSQHFPDIFDWLQFRIENAYAQMQWRVDLIRKLDLDHTVNAHGVAQTLWQNADSGADEWRAARPVDHYGFTWVPARRGFQPWKQFHAVDLTRAGSRGKPFWHAEAQNGPLWMQPQVLNRPRDDGRIFEAEDVRISHFVSMAGGATGYLCPRWRPLLDGPLFGAFGAYGMDGSRTPRSEMASQIGKWANAPEQAALWEAKPIKGDIGIVFVPESQMHVYAMLHKTDMYAEAVRGAYAAFFANNIQADFVHIDDIDQYRVLYLPIPAMLAREHAEAIKRWVAKGGILISESCPAYFGDLGHVGPTQPNFGLDAVFGAKESYVEFCPDLRDGFAFRCGGLKVQAGGYKQAYQPTTGQAMGHYLDGQVAVVDNSYGQGRTRLIGTFPGYGFYQYTANQGAGADEDSRKFFAELLAWAGMRQAVRSSDLEVTARLHTVLTPSTSKRPEDTGGSKTFLWVTNPKRNASTVELELSEAYGPFSGGVPYWGNAPQVSGRRVMVTVGGKDAAVIELKKIGDKG